MGDNNSVLQRSFWSIEIQDCWHFRQAEPHRRYWDQPWSRHQSSCLNSKTSCMKEILSVSKGTSTSLALPSSCAVIPRFPTSLAITPTAVIESFVLLSVTPYPHSCKSLWKLLYQRQHSHNPACPLTFTIFPQSLGFVPWVLQRNIGTNVPPTIEHSVSYSRSFYSNASLYSSLPTTIRNFSELSSGGACL